MLLDNKSDKITGLIYVESRSIKFAIDPFLEAAEKKFA